MKGLAVLLILAWALACPAAEPATTTWVGGLSVASIYIGDYNTAQGRVMFNCTDNTQVLYWFDLNLAWGRAMHAQLLTAYTMGKRVSIMKNTTPSYTNEYQCYRLVIYD